MAQCACVYGTLISMEESQKSGREGWGGEAHTLINDIFLHYNSSSKDDSYLASVAWHNACIMHSVLYRADNGSLGELGTAHPQPRLQL